jgi:hypothetical protein
MMSDELILYWNDLIDEWLASKVTGAKFCAMKSLDYREFRNKIRRFTYIKHSDPLRYEAHMIAAQDYLENGHQLERRQYALKHNISTKELSESATHLRYMRYIELLRSKPKPKLEIEPEPEPENQSMTFVQIPIELKAPQEVKEIVISEPAPPEPEIIQPQNDIELVVAKGVRVMIAPNIEPMKIIKIIELLKDI